MPLVTFLTGNLDVVYFFYGLSFFVLGITIFLRIRASGPSEFRLLGILWLLALFAVVHGANEFVGMFGIIKGPLPLIEVLNSLLLSTSYLMLFLFGFLLFNLSSEEKLGLWFPSAMAILFFGFPVFLGKTSFTMWEISSRYFLGFPSAILCSVGILLYYRNISGKLEDVRLKRYFYCAALAFAAYAVLGGVIVNRADFFPASVLNDASFTSFVGVPVQLFRAVCAVVIWWSITLSMDIFRSETERKLQLSQEETRRANEALKVKMLELEVANTKLGKMDKVKDEFLSIATHDLKGPVTSILLTADSLLDSTQGTMADEQRHLLDTIRTSARALVDLIDSVLDYTRLEFGRIALDREMYSLTSQLMEMAEESSSVADRKHVVLQLHMPESAVHVEADRRMIRRVISNLFGNALKFTPDGGSIQVTLSLNAGEATVVIRDSGVGIESGDLLRIFDKFYMITEEKGRKAHGLGLGLYITRNFIEAHGGRIRAESEGSGKGATFIFSLPVAE